jgi:hypothetical protein
MLLSWNFFFREFNFYSVKNQPGKNTDFFSIFIYKDFVKIIFFKAIRKNRNLYFFTIFYLKFEFKEKLEIKVLRDSQKCNSAIVLRRNGNGRFDNILAIGQTDLVTHNLTKHCEKWYFFGSFYKKGLTYLWPKVFFLEKPYFLIPLSVLKISIEAFAFIFLWEINDFSYRSILRRDILPAFTYFDMTYFDSRLYWCYYFWVLGLSVSAKKNTLICLKYKESEKPKNKRRNPNFLKNPFLFTLTKVK